MKTIEVCFSPALFEFRKTQEECMVVVIDVLRATTAFCAAFDSGVEMIIPVSGLEELRVYKQKGYLTAAEREGEKVDFADYGNSPTVFRKADLSGKTLAYSTTNGTKAVELAKSTGNLIAAAFVNLNAVADYLLLQDKSILILCSGWKNTFSLEDTLCAGALTRLLMVGGEYSIQSDASLASLSLWKSSKDDLSDFVQQASHYKRLQSKGLQQDLQHCFKLNASSVVPFWNGLGFTNITGNSVQ